MGGWHVDGRFTASNDTLLRLIGYSREEVESGQVGICLGWMKKGVTGHKFL